jgi:hypothetical protein
LVAVAFGAELEQFFEGCQILRSTHRTDIHANTVLVESQDLC